MGNTPFKDDWFRQGNMQALSKWLEVNDVNKQVGVKLSCTVAIVGQRKRHNVVVLAFTCSLTPAAAANHLIRSFVSRTSSVTLWDTGLVGTTSLKC